MGFGEGNGSEVNSMYTIERNSFSSPFGHYAYDVVEVENNEAESFSGTTEAGSPIFIKESWPGTGKVYGIASFPKRRTAIVRQR